MDSSYIDIDIYIDIVCVYVKLQRRAAHSKQSSRGSGSSSSDLSNMKLMRNEDTCHTLRSSLPFPPLPSLYRAHTHTHNDDVDGLKDG